MHRADEETKRTRRALASLASPLALPSLPSLPSLSRLLTQRRRLGGGQRLTRVGKIVAGDAHVVIPIDIDPGRALEEVGPPLQQRLEAASAAS